MSGQTRSSITLPQEPELISPTDLCTDSGTLMPGAVGWSRRPLHNCNLSGHWPRKKRWNYWCITNQDVLFSITLSNIDYLGLAFAYFLDFKTGRFTEKTIMQPLGNGCSLGDTVDSPIIFEQPGGSLSIENDTDQVILHAAMNDFDDQPLIADLTIQYPPGHETLNVVIPWSDDRFQFTSKQNCLPTSGVVQIGDAKHVFEPQSALACLDFGRGIWPFQSFWNWASFSCIQNGRSIGANLGGGWTDGTGMTENGIVVDGKLSKISQDIDFQYSASDFMQPWTLTSKSTDQIDLTFTPFFERIAKTDLVLLRSEVHQMIGHFSGSMLTNDGEEIYVDKAVGWAEEHFARW